MYGLVIGLAVQASAAGGSATPATAGPSAQVMFEAATAALDKGDWAGAVRGFEALEARLGARATRSRALSQVRRGSALIRLGRTDEGVRALRSGLAALPAGDASLREDRHVAALMLGQASAADLDYASARSWLAQAATLAPTDPARISALFDLSRVSMFEEPQAALVHIDKALALARAATPADTALVAALQTQRGRVLLNAGAFREGRNELAAAVKGLGGLGLKVDRADVVARSDAAIASLLVGDQDRAREYLAYTGAGRSTDRFAPAAEMVVPPCGDETGLSPADTAVIELSVRDDGSVGQVRPIYASRTGGSALVFARAVRKWTWRPETVAKIPVFFRSATRVQLRCSTEVAGPTLPALLQPQVDAWLQAHKLAPFPADERQVPVPGTLRAELAAREGRDGMESASLLPVLMAMADNAALAGEERADAARRAVRIARASGAPAAVIAYLEVQGLSPHDKQKWQPEIARLTAVAAEPAIAADLQASSVIRLVAGDLDSRSATALTLFRSVANEERLGARDPMRVAAHLRLANAEAATGNLDAAREAYRKTGLEAQQCALVDARPAMTRMGIGSNDFPGEAMRWGFEGWVRTEFDLDANGRTLNQRALVSYPPFVFEEATLNGTRKMRFEQRYRPEGGLGCGGQSVNISFLLPD